MSGVWERIAAHRRYYAEIGPKGLLIGQQGTSPFDEIALSCRLEDFLAGAHHDWLRQHLGETALVEALALARQLRPGA